MQVKTTEIFNLCCMPWVKNLPHVHLKIHDSFNYWATLKKCHGFIYSTFLHMLKRNQVTWWKNDFEISPQSQDFCKQYALGENSHRGKKKFKTKVMSKFSARAYTVKVPVRKSHGWFLTCECSVSFPLWKCVWIFTHKVQEERFLVTYNEG